MNSPRVAIAAAATFLALSACSAGPPPGPGPGSSDAAAAEAALRSYLRAIATRDFAAACGLNTPGTNAHLVKSVSAMGPAVSTCEEALASAYTTARAAQASVTIASTAQVKEVAVDGDTATVTWFANGQDQRVVTNELHRVDGQWRLYNEG